MAKEKAKPKFNSMKNSKPTKVIIPAKATNVPIQKLIAGLFFKNKKEIIPTQTGAKLVKRVDCVALDFWMAIFQTATSEANKTPQRRAANTTFFFGRKNMVKHVD